MASQTTGERRQMSSWNKHNLREDQWHDARGVAAQEARSGEWTYLYIRM